MALGGFAAAQDAAPVSASSGLAPARLPFTVAPSFSASTTFTHGDTQQSGQSRSELITELAPAVHISSRGGPVRGFLDYSLRAVHFARESGNSDLQHALSASATAELVDRRVFIDASASISQQAISAFGPQFVDASTARANRAEVRSYSLTPRLSGTLASLVDYEARLTHTGSRSSGGDGAADSQSTNASLQLRGRTGLSAVSWAVTGSRQVLSFGAGASSSSDRFDGSLIFSVSPQLNLTAHGGRESTDLGSSTRQTQNTYGIGVAWQPSPITSFSLDQQKHPFGSTHQIRFTHRTPRTVWIFTDSRSVTGFAQEGVAVVSAYDRVFQLLASLYPDPDLRATKVNDFLRANGIAPNQQLIGSFLSSSASLQRLQTLGVTLVGVRDTVNLSATQSHSTQLEQATGIFDLSNSSFVREQGFNLGVTHRLTPLSSISLNGSQRRTSGSAVTTRLSSLDLTWSGQVGLRTRASLGARHSVFSSPTAPYTDSALTAGLNLTF